MSASWDIASKVIRRLTGPFSRSILASKRQRSLASAVSLKRRRTIDYRRTHRIASRLKLAIENVNFPALLASKYPIETNYDTAGT